MIKEGTWKPVIRNTHFGLYITEWGRGEVCGVKPVRFGELSVTASSVTLYRYTLTFVPRVFLRMILIKYISNIIKEIGKFVFSILFSQAICQKNSSRENSILRYIITEGKGK